MKRRKFLRSFGLAASGLIFVPRHLLANSNIITANSLKNIQMFNSTWARSVALPSSWSKIRAGVLLYLDPTAFTTLTGTPKFTLGFCHGTANKVGNPTTDHFVGVQSTSATWPYPGNDGRSSDYKPLVDVASTPTYGTAIATNSLYIPCSASAGSVRNVFFVDITKGSPNYTFNIFGPIGIGGDVTVATFLAQMAQSSPSIATHNFFSAQTMAVDEAGNGLLNAINCYWDHTDYAINICALGVTVLA